MASDIKLTSSERHVIVKFWNSSFCPWPWPTSLRPQVFVLYLNCVALFNKMEPLQQKHSHQRTALMTGSAQKYSFGTLWLRPSTAQRQHDYCPHSCLVIAFEQIKTIYIQHEFWSPQLHQHLCLQSTCHLNKKTYPRTPDLHWHQYLHLCVLYWLLDSHNLYEQMTSSLCACYLYTTTFPVLLTTSTQHCIELLPMPPPQTQHGHVTAFYRSPPWFYSYLLSCLYSPHYSSIH